MEWNEQGERPSEFIMSTHTIHGNSQFQKPSHLRWTWESPGGQLHNEIGHIIFNRRFCLTDVAVVPKFYTGSDRRLLRARFCFSVRGERTRKFRKRSPKTSINWNHLYCEKAIKEDLKERRAAAMDEAAEAGKSIRKARRSFANYKTKMT
uniref:40S ribosomal protein S6 n=1 Tax=Haemonchus contortus TaxID=6289 RepID=A0A7I4XVW5_HAECO